MIQIARKTLLPAAVVAGCIACAFTASAQLWQPGNLLVSESFYSDLGQAATLTLGAPLPGGGNAVATGAFPNVFQNVNPDPSFGVSSQITINNFTTGQSLDLNPSQLVTSFSSKSELSLNFSTDGSSLDFMGYIAPSSDAKPVGVLDLSNANTPGHPDSSNPDTLIAQRGVGILSGSGALSVTAVNAYSGNNGRAAIVVNNANGTGANNIYMVGNAGNGSGTEPAAIVNNTGVQMTTVGGSADTTVVGVDQGDATPPPKNGHQFGFSVTQTGASADKSGKDDNFRGETLFNNTLYVTKGSGNNGIDTVYQVGTTGSLPTAGTASSTTISILPGFPTALSANVSSGGFHPFGLFFANATTLYVADEGDGTLADAGTSKDPNAGLEKWSFANGKWGLDYTLRTGLFSAAYTPANYGGIAVTTDGLRDLAGQVNPNGTVTLYSITSTLDNGGGDNGADPNKLVEITDTLADSTSAQASGEDFSTLETAVTGEVLRGLAVAPVPEPTTLLSGALLLLPFGGGAVRRLRKKWRAA